MEVDELLKKLRNYYKNNCKQLVFVNEKRLSTNNSCKMYFLDVLSEQELKNYKKVFQEYLLLYVRNRDSLGYCDSIINANNDTEMSNALFIESKKIRDDTGLYPQTDIKSQGVYGELFDDFYLNIVKDEPILMAYCIRSGFNIANPRGFDLTAVKLENDCLHIIFSEAKFVNSVNSASNALYDDICGNENQEGHVTKKYINDYVSFFINKPHSLYFEKVDDINSIRLKLNELNELLVKDGIKAIDAINRLGIKVRFDFFAIYHDKNYDIEERKAYFDMIVDGFNQKILDTGIQKYDMEIIFIPTKNESMALKRSMEEWD